MDLSSDRDVFGVRSSMDAFKGTSFRYSGNWEENNHYYNDEYIIDCVTYDGGLWVCKQSHHASNSDFPHKDSKLWAVAAKAGTNGLDGKVYIPSFDNGKLIFEAKEPEKDIYEFDFSLDFKVIEGETAETSYIGWSYDRENYTKICDIAYLRNQFHVGPTAPEDPTKIWIDTSESSIGDIDTLDFIYEVHKDAGGTATKDQVVHWMASLGTAEINTDFGEIKFE